MKQAGIIILITGVLLTIFTAAKFFTNEKVVDLGSVEITREKPHSYSWSPVIGVVVMGIGAVVLFKATRK
jgi:hypothetical protein